MDYDRWKQTDSKEYEDDEENLEDDDCDTCEMDADEREYRANIV